MDVSGYLCCVYCFFFFKQKTAYEMRISDWSSDVCSSDLEGHDLLAVGAALAIILVTEGDRGIVEADEAAVRYRNAVGVAGQIGEHGLGPSERRLGINNPALFADRREVPQESASFGKMREAAKESELALIVQSGQPGQEQPAEEGTKHADREQEGWAC